jgi:glycosyltransferase involved in cell wall biosynthesis
VSDQLRVLFYKTDMAWPRASGHDVHTFNLMRSLAGLGCRVAFVTVRRPDPRALEGANLDRLVALDEGPPLRTGSTGLKGFQERFRSYWGVPAQRVAAFGAVARDFQADAVVVSGLDVLPMLGEVGNAVRIWYAADEWVWHHFSQVRPLDPGSWHNVRDGAIKGFYERVFRSRIDRAWVVTQSDARAMRWLAGVADVDLLPNGVDAERYRPGSAPEEPDTAVFWGRLDFGPNIQALEWFCANVWTVVHRQRPSARFTIVGFKPTPPVEVLANAPGVELRPNVEDIRPEVARHAVVVMPFVSGGGIKNKLLEAAAMGKTIVCTQRALLGLKGRPPLRVADGAKAWQATLGQLWSDEKLRCDLGARAREWVVREHTWESAARTARRGIDASCHKRGRS